MQDNTVKTQRGIIKVCTNTRYLSTDLVFEQTELDDNYNLVKGLDICTIDLKSLDALIRELTFAKEILKKEEERKKQLLEHTDFSKLYSKFEDMYNPYPIQMSRSSAFGHALDDGLITQDIYDLACEYYGKLWNYVGD